MKNLKIKHIQTTYYKRTPSGAWSEAQKNIDVTEEFITLGSFKRYTSEETIGFFNTRVTNRTYEKVGYVPTRMSTTNPFKQMRILDEFIFID